MRTRAFWLLAGTFFIRGASTNGLIGTHLIAACHDYGIHEVRSAQLLAMMRIYGSIRASHQLGASTAGCGADAIRTILGDYQVAFWTVGVLCVVAGLSFLTNGHYWRPAPIVAVA